LRRREDLGVKVRIGHVRAWITSVVAMAITAFATVADVWAAQEKINLLPPASFDRFIVYENLALFWIAIIGLIVIIRIKLKEIERIQALGADKEEKDAPVLE
jgi:hypothetical protein